MFQLAIVISISFSFLAAVMAWLITYLEYAKHEFSPARLRRECFRAAGFTFVVWLAITLLAFYFLLSAV
jgi:hypothetical protein